jgi:hypothetical protein
MAHTHVPVIKVTKLPKGTVLNLLRSAPLAVATALGWIVGSLWHLLVLTATGFGMVVGTTFLACKFLAFAVAYGFLKGAHIKLVPKQQRNPSMPM